MFRPTDWCVFYSIVLKIRYNETQRRTADILVKIESTSRPVQNYSTRSSTPLVRTEKHFCHSLHVTVMSTGIYSIANDVSAMGSAFKQWTTLAMLAYRSELSRIKSFLLVNYEFPNYLKINTSAQPLSLASSINISHADDIHTCKSRNAKRCC